MTQAATAAYAVSLGVDEIGLVFAGGPRQVTAAQAQTVIADLPPVTITGLFMNQSAQYIKQILATVNIDQLQFHGQETSAFCDQFERPWTKAIAAGDYTTGISAQKIDLKTVIDDWQSAGNYGPVALVLDAHHSGERGGQGKVFDWQRIPAKPSVPIYLAGGLNADNVGQAVRQVKPYAVDVSSGIEDSPGHKNHVTMQRFVNEVRGADAEIDQQAG